jgi:hypothetical protein
MWPKKTGLVILVAVAILTLTWTVIEGKPNEGKGKVQAPAIERGVFVDYGYSSPPWYPPEEETDTYRWAPRICWAGENLPLAVTVYTGAEPVSGSFGAIASGFTAWDATTSTSLYGSIIEALDGQNTVSWAAIDGPGGIIGATYYWYYTATKEMAEFDIVLDSSDPWSLAGASDAFDVQNIATHEAGHTLVLQDLRSPRDGALTMHAYTWKGDTGKRTLGTGDILGVKAIYGE